MKKFIWVVFISLFISISTSAFTGNAYFVTPYGSVAAQNTLVSIGFYNQFGQFVTVSYCYTDMYGNFSLNVNPGSYTLFVGNCSSNFFVSNNYSFMGYFRANC